MRMRFLAFLSLLVLAATACGQIAVGNRRFVRAIEEAGPRGEWVVYEEGAPRNEGTRRWLTKRVLVELQRGKGARDLEGIPGVRRAEARGRYAVVEFDGREDAGLRGAERLKNLPQVLSAEPMLARRWFPMAVPDDPLFAHNASSPGYQWHLQNTGQNGATAGVDLKVVTAWDNYKGTGVRIGIVDDGLELSHPDLTANIDTLNGYDFNGGDTDPSPGAEDFHGTACAGVAAARGNNGIGVSGTAPQATLVGLKFITAPTTDAEDADMLAFKKDIIQVRSNSWGPFDDAYGASGPGPLARAALEDAALTGRGGKGTIFLWAAGNGNYAGDDSNYDGWANTPFSIAVSAINDKGKPAFYSEPGANILVCAPSGGGKQDITTTDRTGASGYNEDGGLVERPDFTNTDYTNTFNGTSSATPAVAGVVALMLEANPNLTYRDVQDILVHTAVKNDEYSGGWVTNGGGFHFHHRYGAGLVNAKAATDLAASWVNLDPVQTRTISQTALAQPIPDFDEDGITRSFTVLPADNLRLEQVLVQVKATHPYAGNLDWELVSPSGVTSRLARARFNDRSANVNWTFMSTHFWGERSEGTWKLRVRDTMVDHTGTLDEVSITFRGTPVTAPLPTPVMTSPWIIVGREGLSMEHQLTAAHSPTSFYVGFEFFGGLPAGLSFNAATGLISGTPVETGVWAAVHGAQNAAGWAYESAYFLMLGAEPLLSTATEQPSTTKIVPFGFGDPFSQNIVTHDGIDAIETAIVDDEEYSGIEFTVNGPARLQFQWKVSSEKNGDHMVLTVDGYLKGYISGEVDWAQVTTDIGPGEHNVDIYYFKDAFVAKGQDKGWIDQIVITPTSVPPVITTTTVQVYQNVYFREEIEAEHAPSGFAADGLPAGVAIHPSTGLVYGSAATIGSFPVTIHATNTFGTTSKTITLQVGTVEQGLAAVIEAPAQTITSGGDLAWVPQWLYARDGEDAARSGPIDHDQESVMTTQVTGPCKVTFYWGVSSEEDYDFLRFFMDDVEQEAISGEVGWTRKGFLIPAGVHTLKWAYSKDAATARGLDSGFVDQFAIHSDNDGDGIHADLENWFGTSDNDRNSLPQTVLTRSAATTLEFPSVAGNDYRIEYSDDLVEWTPLIITATGSTTTWTDLNAVNKTRRFYRVLIP